MNPPIIKNPNLSKNDTIFVKNNNIVLLTHGTNRLILEKRMYIARTQKFTHGFVITKIKDNGITKS